MFPAHITAAVEKELVRWGVHHVRVAGGLTAAVQPGDQRLHDRLHELRVGIRAEWVRDQIAVHGTAKLVVEANRANWRGVGASLVTRAVRRLGSERQQVVGAWQRTGLWPLSPLVADVVVVGGSTFRRLKPSSAESCSVDPGAAGGTDADGGNSAAGVQPPISTEAASTEPSSGRQRRRQYCCMKCRVRDNVEIPLKRHQNKCPYRNIHNKEKRSRDDDDDDDVDDDDDDSADDDYAVEQPLKSAKRRRSS